MSVSLKLLFVEEQKPVPVSDEAGYNHTLSFSDAMSFIGNTNALNGCSRQFPVEPLLETNG